MAATIVPQIIADAYLEARCNVDNVPAPTAIRYADDVYQELIDEKKLINEDFIKKISKIDTVVYQNTYALPTDFEKMKQVSIKYSAPTYTARATGTAYTVGTKVTNSGKAYIANIAHTAGATFAGDSTKWVQIYEGYAPCTPRIIDFESISDFNNISESNPVYFYDNNNLFIYPRPKTVVVEGVKFDYIPSQPTLTTLTDDALIQIEAKLHDARVVGVAAKYTKYMGKDSSALDYDYMKGIQKCKTRWQGRHYSPVVEELPNSLQKYMR